MTRNKEMAGRWDQRFATPDYAYGTEPNAYFKTFIDTHTPGRILLPAEGEGRNAVYAAEHGWDVHAIDFSQQGRRKALQLAAERKVSIRYDIADIHTFAPPTTAYKAIALIYTHLHKDKRRRFHRQLCRSLEPGGYILLESFTPEQLEYGTGGPKNIDMLYSPDELKTDFRSLQILQLETRIVELNAGRSHKGKGSIVQLLAQKIEGK